MQRLKEEELMEREWEWTMNEEESSLTGCQGDLEEGEETQGEIGKKKS